MELAYRNHGLVSCMLIAGILLIFSCLRFQSWLGSDMKMRALGVTTDTGFSGTIIMTVGYEGGFLVCADKRSYDDVRGELDNDVKITVLNKFSGFSTAGTPIFLRKADLVVMFSVQDLAKQFFETKTPRQFDAQLPAFAELLKTRFREYLAARRFENWPATRLIGQDPILFNVTFFYSHPGAGLKIKRVVFRYVKQSLPLIDTSIEDSSEKRIIGDGAEPILRELLQGNSTDFDQERNDPKIRSVLFDKAWASEITLKEAFDFARAIIKSTSQKGKLLQGMLGSISPSCDCALLTKKGFNWYVKTARLDR